MININILETIIKHKKKCELFIIKDFCTDFPSWQEFIDYLDQSPNTQNLSSNVKGIVMVRNMNWVWSLAMHDYLGKSSKNIEKDLSDLFQVNGSFNSVYVNFSSNPQNVDSHADPLDNFYWQCIGSTEWISENISYKINPGDLVYIPANCYHTVNFSIPRAAMGFSWDLSKSPLLTNSDYIN